MSASPLKVLGIVGARSGSKSIPHKNIRPLCGKPLLAWITEAAKNSKYINRLIISTDSPEYATIAQQYGAEALFLRPAELAKDSVPDFDFFIFSKPVMSSSTSKCPAFASTAPSFMRAICVAVIICLSPVTVIKISPIFNALSIVFTINPSIAASSARTGFTSETTT